MRFCTTCGRNFEEAVDACPHDGTPLFDMGAPGESESPPAVEELVAAEAPAEDSEGSIEAVEAGAVDAESEISEPADDDLFLPPDGDEEELAETSDADQEVGLDDAELAGEDSGGEDEPIEEERDVSVEEAPSTQIAAGIEDALEDMGPMTDDQARVSLGAEADDDDEPIVEPIRQKEEKGGGGGIVMIVLLVAVIAVVAFVVMGQNETNDADVTDIDDGANTSPTPPEPTPPEPTPVATQNAAADAGGNTAQQTNNTVAPDAGTSTSTIGDAVEEVETPEGATTDAVEKEPRQVKPKPKPKAKPEPKAEPKPKPKPKPKAEPEPKAESEPKAEAKTDEAEKSDEEDPQKLLNQELMKLKEPEEEAP